MATVYAATGAEGARVALKILHPEMARRAEVRERFLREAYVANRIGHPGVVRILEHGDGPEVYLVMELLEGEPLSARAQRANEMTLRELMVIADELLDVLGAAHAAGIIHRDVKPDNVFLTKDGRVKVLDFGIARVLDDVPSDFKTRTGMTLGTIPYMAPEQALGRRGQVDGRTDLFALGALLFRVLAGRRIHEAPSEAELLVAMATEPAPKLREVAPNVPRAVCAVVDMALAFSREARYPDARTMQEDVRAVLAGLSPPHATSARGVRDAATRIGRAARPPAAAPAVAPNPPRETPTVAMGAPVAEPTLQSAAPYVAPAAGPASAYGFAPPPSSVAPASFAFSPASIGPAGLALPPPSGAPQSFAAPLAPGQMGLTLPPPSQMAKPARRSSRGAPVWVIVIVLLFLLLLLGGGGLVLAFSFKPWKSSTAAPRHEPRAAATAGAPLRSAAGAPTGSASPAGAATSKTETVVLADTPPTTAPSSAQGPPGHEKDKGKRKGKDR
jgi:serine/threonine-protein kinase